MFLAEFDASFVSIRLRQKSNVTKRGTEAAKTYLGHSLSLPVQSSLITGRWRCSYDVVLQEKDMIYTAE